MSGRKVDQIIFELEACGFLWHLSEVALVKADSRGFGIQFSLSLFINKD